MPESPEERDPLEALAADYTERLRRGENPSAAEYAARYPEWADEVHALFQTIAAMEQLKQPLGTSHGGRVSLGGPRLERLGDFRIVREIGRGGMGIVYEAEQESLGRRVAIKVLPRQALLDPKQLKRFEREARVAAGLHHTNIVEIFGVGEADGFHYFVMQHIEGAGLDQVIEHLNRAQTRPPDADAHAPEADGSPNADGQNVAAIAALLVQGAAPAQETRRDARAASTPLHLGPKYWRAAAHLVLQVAEALQYAHAQGTLHRDIKPANLLVDAHGTVWVTDFGLAKALQSENLTLTGEITGTLRYMAPEQFSGRADARSDIYSLGLTLYELLILRPAYCETEQSRLIERITNGEPVAPRALNPEIPRDIETLVLKATARNPEHRYQSAQELADDLRCFIEDRPVQARRAGAAERLWRWSRRNPAVAAWAGTSLGLLILLAAVGMAGYVRTRAALRGEEHERAKAEANAALAMEAVDRIFERFAPSRTVAVSELSVQGVEDGKIEIPSPTVLSKESAALLEEMLAFYERLAAQAGNDDQLREKIAAANRRVGDLRQRLGQYEPAVAAYRRAIGIYEELAGRAVRKAALKTEIARTHNELGLLYRTLKRSSEAQESYQTALSILEALTREPSLLPETQYQLARTHYFLGCREHPHPGLEPRGGMRPPPPLPGDGGRPGMERPPADMQRRPPPPPGRERPPPDMAEPPPGEAQPPLREEPPRPRPYTPGSPDDPQVLDGHLTAAVSILEDLAQRYPANPNYRYMLALCYRERFPSLARRDRNSALTALSQATETLEGLVRDFPDTPDYRYELCETYALPSDRGLAVGTPRDVEDRLRQALDVSEKLVAEHPSIPQYLASLAQIHHKLGAALRHARQWREAEERDRKAVALQASLVSQFPDVADYKVWLAAFRNSLADVLLSEGKPEEAQPLLKDTITVLDELLKKEPQLWFLHGLLSQNHASLAAAQRATGEAALAAEAEREAEAHREAARRAAAASSPPK